jgi:hypothetical protein
MYMWRRNYPRVRYQPVVCIHGIFYVVKDEIIVKHGKWWEWVYPSSMQPHIRYDPRKLPVVYSPVTQPKDQRWKSLDGLPCTQVSESSPVPVTAGQSISLTNPFLRTL